MNKKSLDYVTKYYRHGAMDIKSAYRKTLRRAAMTQSHDGRQSSGLTAGGRHRARLMCYAVAAAIAILLVGGGIVFFRPTETTLASVDSNRVLTLPDGTIVTLAPHSTLSYRGDCRNVRLTGKAYFNIHHDDSHPFTITDDNYTIRDIGTRLLVDEATGGRTTVYVEEGSIALSSSHYADNGIVLHKAQAATVSANSKPERVVKASQNITTWATHEFHFDNTPLTDVLHDLSAYYHVSLSCGSTDGKRLTADFQADSLQNIIEMIEETMDVKIKR